MKNSTGQPGSRELSHVRRDPERPKGREGADIPVDRITSS